MILLTLRQKLRVRIGATPDDQYLPTSVIDDAINQGIALLDAEALWPWLETSETIVLTRGDFEYALPADWRMTRSIVVTEPNGRKCDLTDIAPADALTYADTAFGRPVVFSTVAGALRVAPAPDSDSYSALHVYYRISPELVEDADVTLIPDVWHPAIISAAGSMIAMREDMRGRKEAFDAEVQQWVRRMRGSLRRSTKPVTPRIRPGGWW